MGTIPKEWNVYTLCIDRVSVDKFRRAYENVEENNNYPSHLSAKVRPVQCEFVIYPKVVKS